MAYKYNELTGEFEDIPQEQGKTKSSPVSSAQRRTTLPPGTNASTSQAQPEYRRSNKGVSDSRIFYVILRIMLYISISASISMCN